METTSRYPSEQARRQRYTLLIASTLAITSLTGCGGGLTQEDMRRHAIRRPAETEEEPPRAQAAAKTKPVSQPQADAKRGSPPGSTKPEPAQSVAAVADGSTPTTPATATVAPPTATASVTPPSKPLEPVERRRRSLDNLRQLADAMLKYCQDHGRFFPQAIQDTKGNALLSWRVELLPYLGYQELYDQFNLQEPWDSPMNEALLARIPPVYQSPERFDEKTNYLVPVASFALFGHQRPTAIRRVQDGVENTVALLEVDDAAAVPWTQPADLEVDIARLDTQVGTLRGDGFFVVWGNGAITRVAPERTPADLKAILSYDGGDTFSAHVVRAKADATPATMVADAQPRSTVPDAIPTADATTAAAAVDMAPLPPGNSPTPPRHGERLPVPDSLSLDRARNLVRQIYEEDYEKAKTPSEVKELTKRMLKQVSDMSGDPAGQYIVLDIVVQISTRFGDSDTALTALEQMAERFSVDELKMAHDVLVQLSKRKERGHAVNQALLDEAEQLIERALHAEQFEMAETLCQIALGAARQLEDDERETDIEQLKSVVDEAHRAYRTIRRTLATLQQDDDPKANLEVGRYYCLIRGEWDKGLPLLAQSQHPRLKELAEIDLRAPAQAAAQLELADGWWELGDDDAPYRKSLRLRASHWYQQALQKLPPGLLKIKAELRLKQVREQYGEDALASVTGATMG